MKNLENNFSSILYNQLMMHQLNLQKFFSCNKFEIIEVIISYFGAHWAEPCLNFNPILINFYNDVRADDPSRLEIVYISMDSHDKYFQ